MSITPSSGFSKAGIYLKPYLDKLDDSNKLTSTGTTSVTDGYTKENIQAFIKKYDENNNGVLEKDEIDKMNGERDKAFSNFLQALSQNSTIQRGTSSNRYIVSKDGSYTTYFDADGKKATKTIERSANEDGTYHYTITEFKDTPTPGEKIVKEFKGPQYAVSTDSIAQKIDANNSNYKIISEKHYPASNNNGKITYSDQPNKEYTITNGVKTYEEDGKTISIQVNNNGTIKNGGTKTITETVTIDNIEYTRITQNTVTDDDKIKNGTVQTVTLIPKSGSGNIEVMTMKVDADGKPYNSSTAVTTKEYAQSDWDSANNKPISSNTKPVKTTTAYKNTDGEYITTKQNTVTEVKNGVTTTLKYYANTDGSPDYGKSVTETTVDGNTTTVRYKTSETTYNTSKPQVTTVKDTANGVTTKTEEYINEEGNPSFAGPKTITITHAAVKLDGVVTTPAYTAVITTTYTGSDATSTLTLKDSKGTIYAKINGPKVPQTNEYKEESDFGNFTDGKINLDSEDLLNSDNNFSYTNLYNDTDNTRTITSYKDGEIESQIRYRDGVGVNFQKLNFNDSGISFDEIKRYDLNGNFILDSTELDSLKNSNQTKYNALMDLINNQIKTYISDKTGITTIKANNGGFINYVDKDNNVTKTIEKNEVGGKFQYTVTEYNKDEKIVKVFEFVGSGGRTAEQAEKSINSNASAYKIVSEKHYPKETNGYSSTESSTITFNDGIRTEIINTEGGGTIKTEVEVNNSGTIKNGGTKTITETIPASGRESAKVKVTTMRVNGEGKPYPGDRVKTEKLYIASEYNANPANATPSEIKTLYLNAAGDVTGGMLEEIAKDGKGTTITKQAISANGDKRVGMPITITHSDLNGNVTGTSVIKTTIESGNATSTLTKKDAQGRITDIIQGPAVPASQAYDKETNFTTSGEDANSTYKERYIYNDTNHTVLNIDYSTDQNNEKIINFELLHIKLDNNGSAIMDSNGKVETVEVDETYSYTYSLTGTTLTVEEQYEKNNGELDTNTYTYNISNYKLDYTFIN